MDLGSVLCVADLADNFPAPHAVPRLMTVAGSVEPHVAPAGT